MSSIILIDKWEVNHIGSTQIHILMVTLIVVAILLIVRNKNKLVSKDKKISNILGIFILTVWIVYSIYNFLPSNFNLEDSLPIQVCDVLAIASVLVLLTNNRKASAFLYFCALPLATQAIITPTGEQNPFLIQFWLFWFLHAGIIITSVYDIVIRKYRPSLKSYFFTLLCDIVYIIIILPVDILTDANYGFLGNTSPERPTMIDFFGSWPIRILWLFMALALVQLVMYFLSHIHKKKS